MNFIPIMEGYPDYIRLRMEKRDLNRRNVLPEEINGNATELVLEDLLLWDVKSLKVSFKGGDSALHQKIAETAAEWSRYANLVFDFGYNPATQQYREWIPEDESHIRVGFQDPGYWSFVGKDSQDPEISLLGEITLNLEKFDLQLPANYKTVVLHEFGHALGFHHEHQSPVSKCDFDWERVYHYLAGPPNYWSKEQVDFNLRKMPAGGLTYSPHDVNSIMHYAFPAWMFLSRESSPCYARENNDLSEEDIRMATEAYPFDEEKLAQLRVGQQQLQESLLKHKSLTISKKSTALEDRIKKNILIAAGQVNEDPKNLSNDMELGNLLPTSSAYQFLADLLDELVKEHNAESEIKVADIQSCGTVGDCIRLVNSKV